MTLGEFTDRASGREGLLWFVVSEMSVSHSRKVWAVCGNRNAGP